MLCRAVGARPEDNRQVDTSHQPVPMITLPSLLFDSLWSSDLPALATMSYMSWYRGAQKGWKWAHTSSDPHLAPLTISLVLFCSGMALSGATSRGWPAPWWQTFAWSLLAVLFAFQAVQYVLLGRRTGWDSPIEGTKHRRAKMTIEELAARRGRRTAGSVEAARRRAADRQEHATPASGPDAVGLAAGEYQRPATRSGRNWCCRRS